MLHSGLAAFCMDMRVMAGGGKAEQHWRSSGPEWKVGSHSSLLWVLEELTAQAKHWRCSKRHKVFPQPDKRKTVSPLLDLTLACHAERTGVLQVSPGRT